jgi:hypothetical protein
VAVTAINLRQENIMESEHGFGEKLAAKLAEIKTLKDEIKVNVHLASMQLREEWKSLEKKLPDPAAVKGQLRDKAAETLERVSKELQEFSARLRGSSPTDTKTEN